MMKKEFLLSKTLSATTTASEVQTIVDSFLKANGLSWLNFKHICTNGTPATIGVEGGFVTLVKNEWPHVTSSHCLSHRCSFASKALPLHLMEVKNVGFKMINFICLISTNHRLFQLLAEEMEAQQSGTFVLYQSPLAFESQIPILVV